MKNFLKQNWLKLIIILFLGIFIFLIFTKNNNEVEKEFGGNDLSLVREITCTYPQIMRVIYQDGKIVQSLPEPETHPFIFTFTNLSDPQFGKINFLDSTQTISTNMLVKLADDEDKIIYVEGTGENYLTIHRIFKKSGVAIYSKTVDLFGFPSGSMAMGSCVGY